MTLKARVLACALLGGALSQPTVCVSLHACHPLHTRACATHIDPAESCACMCACVCVCVFVCVWTAAGAGDEKRGEQGQNRQAAKGIRGAGQAKRPRHQRHVEGVVTAPGLREKGGLFFRYMRTQSTLCFRIYDAGHTRTHVPTHI